MALPTIALRHPLSPGSGSRAPSFSYQAPLVPPWVILSGLPAGCWTHWQL